MSSTASMTELEPLLRALSLLSPDELAMLEAENRRLLTYSLAGKQIWNLFPDQGPLRRDLYPRHLEFFAAGALHDERAFIAANRIGKTACVCYEATLHLIGEYPKWWVGRRFDRPIIAWIAGEDVKAVRESLQPMLIGPVEDRGTGLIPRDALVRSPMLRGAPDAIDFVEVKHKSGKSSRLLFKNYEQGRESFQSAKVDVGVFDEEPPLDIYTEMLTRTLATVPGERNGCVLCAFTPLKGLSETVLQFLPGGAYPQTEELRKEAWGWTWLLGVAISSLMLLHTMVC